MFEGRRAERTSITFFMTLPVAAMGIAHQAYRDGFSGRAEYHERTGTEYWSEATLAEARLVAAKVTRSAVRQAVRQRCELFGRSWLAGDGVDEFDTFPIEVARIRATELFPHLTDDDTV